MSLSGILDTLKWLTPYDLPECSKVRIGGAFDGGYIMVDRFSPSQRVFSYGLSWNIAFEIDLAERGHTLFMFDHTIAALNSQHPNFNWHREGLADVAGSGGDLFTLLDHVTRLAPGETGMILKLDVEGAKWDALAEIDDGLLARFDQIVIEMHEFRNIADEAWAKRTRAVLAKLGRHFTLHHVHANNCAPVLMAAGQVPVADVIEASYIRSDLTSRAPLSIALPSAIDAPNDPSHPDIPLWFYPYLPVAGGARTTHELFRLAAERADLILAKQTLERAAANRIPAPGVLAGARQLPHLDAGASLRILLISVHPVLEYDEIQLFEELGHQVCSLGYYFDRSLDNGMRPKLPGTEWHQQCAAVFVATGSQLPGSPAQYSVTPAFVDLFDVVIVDHNNAFVDHNWAALSGTRVVLRTIGQGLHWAEDSMRGYRARGLKIVRWSPEERLIHRYIGADAVIRASKRPQDWGGWTGEVPKILTFNNDFRAREQALNLDFHQASVRDFPFDLFGLRNDGIPNWRGAVSFDDQQDLLRKYRVAFVTGTSPAPYTLGFIEAWMTGIPVVHIGRNKSSRGVAGAYEVDGLITHGETGFLVEDVDEARGIFDRLLRDMELCERISAAGRAAAITYFGWERAKVEWTTFLLDQVIPAE